MEKWEPKLGSGLLLLFISRVIAKKNRLISQKNNCLNIVIDSFSYKLQASNPQEFQNHIVILFNSRGCWKSTWNRGWGHYRGVDGEWSCDRWFLCCLLFHAWTISSFFCCKPKKKKQLQCWNERCLILQFWVFGLLICLNRLLSHLVKFIDVVAIKGNMRVLDFFWGLARDTCWL